MAVFLFKRFSQALIVLFVISLISFSIHDNLGDPLREMVGQSVSEKEREALREELGLNDPFLEQYGRFLYNAIQGDLGKSYFFKEPALSVILKKLPATLELVFVSALLIILISVPSGILCAIYPRNLFSKIIMGVSVLGISVPVFLTAIFCIYFFSVELGWLPAYGRGKTEEILGIWDSGLFNLDGLSHIILPSFSLSSIMLPLFIRLIRSEMIEALQSEYVRYARAKGIRKHRIWLVHAFKNTLLPVITVGGVQIGIMVAYTILTETVFQWPGMGFLFLEAVNRVDTPLIIAYVIVVGLIFVITNTIVDMIYVLINPTISFSSQGNK